MRFKCEKKLACSWVLTISRFPQVFPRPKGLADWVRGSYVQTSRNPNLQDGPIMKSKLSECTHYGIPFLGYGLTMKFQNGASSTEHPLEHITATMLTSHTFSMTKIWISKTHLYLHWQELTNLCIGWYWHLSLFLTRELPGDAQVYKENNIQTQETYQAMLWISSESIISKKVKIATLEYFSTGTEIMGNHSKTIVETY